MSEHDHPYEGRIVCDPRIMAGKPTIKGTRLTVQHVLENLSGGMSVEDYVQSYRGATVDGVKAALAYAAEHLPGPMRETAAAAPPSGQDHPYEGRIVRDPRIKVGKPTIKGTRLTVQHVLENLAGGMSFKEYLDEFPDATLEGVRAAFAYAADHLTPSHKIIAAE